MHTLRQSVYNRGEAGEPLPTVWNTLEEKKIRFLRGQMALICAAPGIGKSAFILTYALKAQIPTMYFSADSDSFTQTSRAISILTGCSMESAGRQYRSQRLEPDSLAAMDAAQVEFDYNAAPTLDNIEEPLEAFGQKFGEYPSMIVVDNVTNVVSGYAGNDEDPFGGLESLMEWMHKMGRDTGAFVAGLHHVTGPYNNGNIPIPLSGIKGQIGRVPEMVLTLHRLRNEYGPDQFNVSPVKNRTGGGDPSGMTYASLDFTGDTMQIVDPT